MRCIGDGGTGFGDPFDRGDQIPWSFEVVDQIAVAISRLDRDGKAFTRDLGIVVLRLDKPAC